RDSVGSNAQTMIASATKSLGPAGRLRPAGPRGEAITAESVSAIRQLQRALRQRVADVHEIAARDGALRQVRRRAGEVRGVVDVARAVVNGLGRVRAHRARARYVARRIELGGDDLVRRYALLDPLDHGTDHMVVGVAVGLRRFGHAAADRIRTGAATAVAGG